VGEYSFGLPYFCREFYIIEERKGESDSETKVPELALLCIPLANEGN
jgi:hypothetical protein